MFQNIAHTYMKERERERTWYCGMTIVSSLIIHVTGMALLLLLPVEEEAISCMEIASSLWQDCDDSDDSEWLGVGLSRKHEDSRCLLR